MKIKCNDHIVMTVVDIDASVAFYKRVYGMAPTSFAGERKGLLLLPREKDSIKPAEKSYPMVDTIEANQYKMRPLHFSYSTYI